MHAMKTKPHSYLDLLSKMKTSFASLLIGLILSPSSPQPVPATSIEKRRAPPRSPTSRGRCANDRGPPATNRGNASGARAPIARARPQPSLDGRGRLSVEPIAGRSASDHRFHPVRQAIRTQTEPTEPPRGARAEAPQTAPPETAIWSSASWSVIQCSRSRKLSRSLTWRACNVNSISIDRDAQGARALARQLRPGGSQTGRKLHGRFSWPTPRKRSKS